LKYCSDCCDEDDDDVDSDDDVNDDDDDDDDGGDDDEGFEVDKWSKASDNWSTVDRRVD
jgi:hypothetical protein